MGADHLITIGANCGCEQDGCIHRRGVELNRIADRYYDRLVRFFKRRSSSREDTADLAQDTFARLWSTDLRQIQKPESFLFTTALNLLRDRARSAQVRHAALSVPAEEELLVCPAPPGRARARRRAADAGPGGRVGRAEPQVPGRVRAISLRGTVAEGHC